MNINKTQDIPLHHLVQFGSQRVTYEMDTKDTAVGAQH